MVVIIRQTDDQLNTASHTGEELRSPMNKTASKLPEYPVIMVGNCETSSQS